MYNNPFATFDKKKSYLKWVESNWNHLRKNCVRKSTFVSNEIKVIEKMHAGKRYGDFTVAAFIHIKVLLKMKRISKIVRALSTHPQLKEIIL